MSYVFPLDDFDRLSARAKRRGGEHWKKRGGLGRGTRTKPSNRENKESGNRLRHRWFSKMYRALNTIAKAKGQHAWAGHGSLSLIERTK